MKGSMQKSGRKGDDKLFLDGVLSSRQGGEKSHPEGLSAQGKRVTFSKEVKRDRKG